MIRFQHLEKLPLVAKPLQGNNNESRASVSVIRPYFLAGILSVLTAGCLLGAVALMGISARRSYTASEWTPYVLAHANSQLYGWVGLFIMGFALQQHAPSISRLKLFRGLAVASMALMLSGIVLRFAAEPLTSINPTIWLPVGIAACTMQLIAVLAFLANLGMTRHRTGERLPWQSTFIFASLTYLLVVAAAEPFVFVGAHQADTTASILFVAKWFPAVREAQFLGFVASMIFGVALTKMHTCFGMREAIKGIGLTGFVVWQVGVLMRMFGWVSGFSQGLEPGSMSTYYLSGGVLAFGAVMIISALGVFEPFTERNRSQKFIRTAFVWLIVGGILMTIESVRLKALAVPFSHAYTGAIRHALTVGFISQMIVGVSTHVISRFAGIDDRRQPSLWIVWILLNAGNAVRVAAEIMSDTHPVAFAWMGPTGFVELMGLVVWAFHVMPILIRSRRREAAYAC